MRRFIVLVVMLAGCEQGLTAREVCQSLAWDVCHIQQECGVYPEVYTETCITRFVDECCPDYGCDWESTQTADDQAECSDTLWELTCDALGRPLPPGCPAPKGGLKC